MPSNAPLPEAEMEMFARLLAQGMAPLLAYTESRVGIAKACSVDQAQRLPGMWARVEWLKKAEPEVIAAPTTPFEDEIDYKNVQPEDVKRMLLHDHKLARTMGQVSAAVRAAELLGKQEGMFVDRSEQKIDVTHTIASRLDEAIKRVSAKVIDVTPKALPAK